ncbi:Uncharacterized protein YJR142W [Gryllus bimaculatus]|nr:Uncharacterized protein YJR142W [Gryllus bimaculatus]
MNILENVSFIGLGSELPALMECVPIRNLNSTEPVWDRRQKRVYNSNPAQHFLDDQYIVFRGQLWQVEHGARTTEMDAYALSEFCHTYHTDGIWRTPEQFQYELDRRQPRSTPRDTLTQRISSSRRSDGARISMPKFFFESERGLFPNTEFVFDLELPLDFVPYNSDGEVEKFELLPADQALEKVFSTEFKTTSCPVVVDFLIRHGKISPENEPNFPQIVELLHVPLQSLYRTHRRQPPAENGQNNISMN